MDGTGWSTHPFERWLDHRLEVETVRHGWVKLHIISGDLTNVISRAVISPSNHHDNPYFRELVTSTAQHFKMSKVQADMAYSSRVNYDLARRLGAELYVPFKSNTVPWWMMALLGPRHCDSLMTTPMSSTTNTISAAMWNPRIRP